jgi:YD repeat-containing protein
MKKLIRKILREHKSDKYYRFLDRVSTMIRMPYFKSMGDFTIDKKDEQEYIMKKILGNDISIEGRRIDVGNGKIIYEEYSDAWWEKFEYDNEGNKIYEEDSDGHWEKYKYDDNGNMIYSERSNGRWWIWEYNNKGKQLYYENSDGFWQKYEYDDNGNQIYYENSDGEIEDNR